MVQLRQAMDELLNLGRSVPSDKLTCLWKITILTGKTHYFYGHFQWLFSYSDITKGYIAILHINIQNHHDIPHIFPPEGSPIYSRYIPHIFPKVHPVVDPSSTWDLPAAAPPWTALAPTCFTDPLEPRKTGPKGCGRCRQTEHVCKVHVCIYIYIPNLII